MERSLDVPSPHAIAVSPDGKVVGVVSDDRHARFWSSGKMTNDISLSGPGTSVAIFGTRAATGSSDGNVRILDLSNGAVVVEIPAHKGAVRGVAFSGGFLVSVGDDKLARVWDATSGKPVRDLGTHDGALRAVATAGDFVGLGGDEGTMHIFGASTGLETCAFEHTDVHPYNLAFSNEGKRLIVSGPETLETWDVQTLHRPKLLDEARKTVASAAPFGKDGHDVVVLGGDGFAIWNSDSGVSRDAFVGKRADKGTGVWSSADGSLALVSMGASSHIVSNGKRTEIKTGPVSSALFSKDNRLLLVGGSDGKVRIFSADGTPIQTFDLDPAMAVLALGITPDRKRVFAFGSGAVDSIIGLWNLEQRTFRSVRNVSREATAAAFTADASELWIGNIEGAVLVWGTNLTTMTKRFEAHQGAIRAIAINGDLTATSGEDGVVRLWKREMPPLTLATRGDDWLVFSNDGVFDASRTGADLVSIVDRSSVYAIDQFALRTNRPDILLERYGLGTAEMRGYLTARAEKRMKKAGLTGAKSTLDFAVPTVNIAGLKQDAKNATVEFSCKASGERTLKSFRIAVNNVPVVEKPIQGPSFSTSETVELSAGSNDIDVSCLDTTGLESFRVKRSVLYAGETKGNLFYVGFGVSKYKESRLDLAFAHKDAQDLGKALGAMKGFEKVDAKMFVNAEVDANALQSAKTLLSKSKVDDTVVVFVAGHGIHARDKEATYYYVVHASDPKRLAETAVPFEKLEGLFEGLAARKKLLLLDTCESGDVDDFPGEVDTGQKIRARSRSARGLVLEENAAPVRAEAKPAPTELSGKRRDYLRQRDRLIYDDLTMRTGAIVLASSQGSESSYESDDVQNGFFTNALIASFTAPGADLDRDGRLEAHELRTFVAANVSKRSSGRQNPTIDRDNRLQRVYLPPRQ